MTEQELFFKTIPCDKYDLLTKEEIIALYEDAINLNKQMQNSLKQAYKELFKQEQKSFLLGEQTLNIKNRLFGRSSEKSPRTKKKKQNTNKGKRYLLPSLRYPNADIIEKDVTLDTPPTCPHCNIKMQDSGLTEDSEYLTVIPKRYYIVKQKRHKYRCNWRQGALITAPAIPRITPGGSYSDEMILDATLSKYCDLIPMERYSEMAARSEMPGIPANSLIQATHHVANFLEGVYQDIKDEVLSSTILHADETPHRMLEGDKKTNWRMWGFSTDSAAYFENHATRAGDVAIELLKESNCEFLVSDVYSGYRRAARECNKFREENNQPKIHTIYCNAHARRKFKEAEHNFKEETKLFLWSYERIYYLEKKKHIDFAWVRRR